MWSPVRTRMGPPAKASVPARACVGGALRGRESDEECVALRVDLYAAVGPARIAQRPAVLGERLAVRLRAELPEQPSRALDVGEEEGDRPARKIGPHRTRE